MNEMKKAKLYLSLLLALVLVAGALSSRHIYAADDTFSVKVEETESGVALKIVAEKELSFGGVVFTVSFDDTVFTYDGISSPLDVTEGPDGIMLDSGKVVTVNAGDSIAVLTYTAKNIQPDVKYTFQVTVTEAYDESFNDHVEAGTVLTGTFTKPVEKYTIKFVNYDGTELQSSEVKAGEMPEYTGETPTKPETDQYTYTFKGWTPELAAATANATYTATYTETAKPTEATETSAETTEAPVETTAAPAATTAAPVETTAAPTETTAASEETTTVSTEAASTEKETTTPETGDDSAMPVFIVTGCAAAVLLGVLLFIRKKNSAE